MPEQPYKTPEVTSEMKIKYYTEAERRYRTMPEDKLQKEYNRLIRGETPWEWFKERVGSVFNMVKIAALSLFLGRQETARRIQFGNREAEFDELKKEAQKEAKIITLGEKLESLQKRQKDKSKESSDIEKKEQEPENNKEQANVQDDVIKELKAEKEAEAFLPERENAKYVSMFAEQIENATDKYKAGLRKYLQKQTGINGAYINIENVTNKNKSFLRISFDSITFPEYSELSKGITIDRSGNCLEQTKTASEITKAVLYYTAEANREFENYNRIIETVPSHAACTEVVQTFIDKIGNQENGDINCDFLHEITRAEVAPTYYIKYSGVELKEKFDKTLNDMLRDGGESARYFNFHTHCVQITTDAQEIYFVSIDGDSVYRAIEGKQKIGQIAEHIADNLGEKLALDDMYRYDEFPEKLEDVIEFSNTDIQIKEEVSDFEQTMEYDDYDDELEQ